VSDKKRFGDKLDHPDRSASLDLAEPHSIKQMERQQTLPAWASYALIIYWYPLGNWVHSAVLKREWQCVKCATWKRDAYWPDCG
jgi:hypothetical protein